MTSDELSALNFFEVCEAVRAGTVSPDTAADETLYRPTLTIAAVNRGIISPTASRAGMRRTLVAHFEQLFAQGPSPVHVERVSETGPTP
jgi:hypothetical protein